MKDRPLRYRGYSKDYEKVFLDYAKKTSLEDIQKTFELSYESYMIIKYHLRTLIRIHREAEINLRVDVTESSDGSKMLSPAPQTVHYIFYILEEESIDQYAMDYKRGKLPPKIRELIEYFEIESRYPEYFI